MTRFALCSIAISLTILVLDAGNSRGSGMTRPPVIKHARFQEAAASFVLYTWKESLAREEACFQVAELLYRRKLYPRAVEFYRCLLASEKGRRRREAIQRLYEIATYWLDDTWTRLKQGADFKPPEWLVWVYPYDVLSEVLPDLNTPDWLDWVNPHYVFSEIFADPKTLFRRALFFRNLLHWDDSKPPFNEEGRAIELLRYVHDSDPAGPFADKTLYLMGYVAWFNEDYRRADECFSCLEKNHPSLPYYLDVIELAIKAKLMRDGTVGDRQQLLEARRLIIKALKLPKISEDEKSDLWRLYSRVRSCLADLDFREAEKCQLAGRWDEARARYQRICEDYPNSYDADRARLRLMMMMLMKKAK